MARNRNDWGPDGEAIFADGAKRGLTAREIAAAMQAVGVKGASSATIQRRLREKLGPRATSKVPLPTVADPPARPVALDDIPEDEETLSSASTTELDWWLSEVKRALVNAKGGTDTDGNPIPANPAVLASLAARATALLEAKRKAAPPVYVDPNDALDIVEAAGRARRLFHDTLSNIIGNRGRS